MKQQIGGIIGKDAIFHRARAPHRRDPGGGGIVPQLDALQQSPGIGITRPPHRIPIDAENHESDIAPRRTGPGIIILERLAARGHRHALQIAIRIIGHGGRIAVGITERSQFSGVVENLHRSIRSCQGVSYQRRRAGVVFKKAVPHKICGGIIAPTGGIKIFNAVRPLLVKHVAGAKIEPAQRAGAHPILAESNVRPESSAIVIQLRAERHIKPLRRQSHRAAQHDFPIIEPETTSSAGGSLAPPPFSGPDELPPSPLLQGSQPQGSSSGGSGT